MTAWTEDDDKVLKDLWAIGQSASQIAAALPGARSRNSIIGRIHRLKQKGMSRATHPAHTPEQHDGKPQNNGRPPPKPAKAAALKWGPGGGSKPSRPKFTAEHVDDIARYDLTELHPHMCKWPVGHPGQAGFGFCGLDRHKEEVYCAGHFQRSRAPKQPRPITDKSAAEIARRAA